MKFNRFEDIIAWQKSQDLAVEIYAKFANVKDFSFKDQICRASVSISNNIAEGYDRQSDKEFARFLYIAKGSASEVKSMLYMAARLGYMTNEDAIELRQLSEEISKIIRGIIKYLYSNPSK